MFTKARIKLTIWYLAVIMVISLAFSGVIYRFATDEISRFEQIQRLRIERHLLEGDVPKLLPRPLILPNPELLEEVRQRVFGVLVLANLVIFISSGALGYFLAGRTLSPIACMVEEQNRFISDASHELKTPLTSLKSVFEVFLRDKKSNIVEARKIISESVEEVDKLQNLSESLLQLAVYQKTPRHLKMERVNLPDVTFRIVKRMSAIFESKKMPLVVKNTPVTVIGDEILLERLFTVLLENAAKYGRSGSEVEVFVGRLGKTGQIIVTNEGEGISAKDLPHIFDRFYRADIARAKNSVGGYGLGLSIAKEVVELHHGSIKAESVPGKKTSFMVTLPAVS